MDTEHRLLVRQILRDAAVLSGAEREQYIQRSCEGKEDLLRIIQQEMAGTEVLSATVTQLEPSARPPRRQGTLRPGDDIKFIRRAATDFRPKGAGFTRS